MMRSLLIVINKKQDLALNDISMMRTIVIDK